MRNTGTVEALTAFFGEAESRFNPYFIRTYRKPTSSVGKKNVLPSHGPRWKGCPKRAYETSRKVSKGDSATMAQKPGSRERACNICAAPMDSPNPNIQLGLSVSLIQSAQR